MKVLTYLIIILLMIASCDSSDKKTNKNNGNLSVDNEKPYMLQGIEEEEEEEEEEQKELSYDEKRDSTLTAMGIKTRDWDSIYAIIRDTTYANKKIKSIKLQADSCPFMPYMLIVDNNKLQLCNRSFDSIYIVNTKLNIQTASISPSNNREIFVLAQSNIRTPDKKLELWYNPTLFDLDLYKLNLDSMTMEGITRLYDNSIPFLRVQMELARFFPDTAELRIDAARNLIYYNCILETFADEAYLYGTYIVDLNKGRTTLGKLKGFEPNFIKGEDVHLYTNTDLSIKENFKMKASKDHILITEIPGNKPSIKIPKYILSQSPTERNIEEEGLQEYYDNFNISFVENDEKIIFSYCLEQEMGRLIGNIYFASTVGENLKMILEDQVLGYYTDLRKIDDRFYLIERQSDRSQQNEILIYDTNFKLVKQFKKLNHYELFPW